MPQRFWEASTDPYHLLEVLRGKASDRKLRLFAVACCRRICHLLENEKSRAVVDVAEQFADGQATAETLGTAWWDAYSSMRDHDMDMDVASDVAWGAILPNGKRLAGIEDCKTEAPLFPVLSCAYGAADVVALAAGGVPCLEALPLDQRKTEASRILVGIYKNASREELTIQCHLLRDVFLDPDYPVEIDRRCQTVDSVEVARTIYDDRSFSLLPVLAKALLDAGCNDEAIIGHCRGGGDHVRGCWLVDLLLGKD